MAEKDKILTIKDHLTGEAREFLMNKSQDERKKLSRVFKLLSGRFGSAQNQRQARIEFNSKYQKSKESVDRFIDGLEALRARAFPNEDKETRNGEILQRFVAGVKDRSIHTMLITTYCSSRNNHAPSIEELRKTVKEFVSWKEIRQEDKEGYGSYRSRDTDQRKETSVDPSNRTRTQQGNCYNCGHQGNFVKDCPHYRANLNKIPE